MIRVHRQNIMKDGSYSAYSPVMLTIGTTVPVIYGNAEGTAIVTKTSLVVSGQLHLVYLDVDWTSFEGTIDGD